MLERGKSGTGYYFFEMSTSRQLPWHSSPSVSSPNPVAQPNNYNNLRRPGTPPRVSLDRAASGQSRSHNIMTEELPSKPIPSSWRAWRSFASVRETRITNHPPASHKHRRTTSAKESTTSPRTPRPTRPRRVTLAPVTATPTAPDILLTMQAIPKPTRGAQSVGDGLGRIVSTTPLSPPVHQTRTSPTLPCPEPSIHCAPRPASGLGQRPTHRTNLNLPRLAESAIFCRPTPKPANKPNSKRALWVPRRLPAVRRALRAHAATVQTAIQSQFRPRLPASRVGLPARVTTKTNPIPAGSHVTKYCITGWRKAPALPRPESSGTQDRSSALTSNTERTQSAAKPAFQNVPRNQKSGQPQ